MRSDFDLVIFDLDGTLVDTAPDIATALAAALVEANVAAPPLAVVKQLVGDGGRELVRRALAVAGVERDVDQLFARFVAHYRDHVSGGSVIYGGVEAALAALAAAGIATAVVTNKPGDIARRLLADLALTDRFRARLGVDINVPIRVRFIRMSRTLMEDLDYPSKLSRMPDHIGRLIADGEDQANTFLANLDEIYRPNEFISAEALLDTTPPQPERHA